MAGVEPYYDHDTVNGRIMVGWTESGIVHRTNILLYGRSRIELHSHSYDHTARITCGRHRKDDGREFGPGDEVFIAKGEPHSFERIDTDQGPGVIDCYWPEGADQ